MLAAVALVVSPAEGGADSRISVVGLFKDAALVVIDGQRRLLRKGQTSPEGVKLHAANSKQALLEFQGQRKTYGLGGTIGGHIPEPESVKVNLYANAADMFEAVGSINGFPVNFIVDTGATLVSMNSIEARRMGIDYRLVGQARDFLHRVGTGDGLPRRVGARTDRRHQS